MKYFKIFIFALVMLPVMAFASDVNPDIITIVQTLLPDKAKEIVGVLSLVVVIWTQLRALIPPTWLAKLPKPIIVVLECIAGNSRNASNAYHNDPVHIRKMNKINKQINLEKDSDGE